MKIKSKEEAFDIIETQKSGMPFEAIKYLRDYGKDDEILKKVIDGLENYQKYSNVPLLYAIVGEGHLDLALVDPVIGFYTSDEDLGDLIYEQGQFLIGKLLHKFGDKAVEKCLNAIFRLNEIDSEAPYFYLFDSLIFADLDKYDTWISKILEKRDSVWALALYRHIAHPRFERYLPQLKRLHHFYRRNRSRKRIYQSYVNELKETIDIIEQGDDFIEWEDRFYCEARSDWDTYYEGIEYERDVNPMEDGSLVFIELLLKLKFEDVVNYADEAIQAFNRKIFQEEIEDQMVGEFLVEFTEKLENRRMYSDIEKLHKVLIEHNPDLLISDGEYTVDTLFKYYCFKGERENTLGILDSCFEVNYEKETIFNKLIYFACSGFSDRVDRFIEDEYHHLVNFFLEDNILIFKLKYSKLILELEKLYLSNDDKKDIDIEELVPKMKPYEFDIDPFLGECVELGFKDRSIEKIEELLSTFPNPEKRVGVTLKIGMRFFADMHEIGCPFLVSHFIWDKINYYQMEANTDSKDWADFFSFKSGFENFIVEGIGSSSDWFIDGPLITWGAYYFLDFLFKYNIIDEKQYNAQTKILDGIKGIIICFYKFYLWEYHFIHKWEAPKSIGLEAWKKEEKEFAELFDRIPNDERTEDKIREFAAAIKRSKKAFAKNKKKSKGRGFSKDGEKIGRNDKVSVKYPDGRVVNNVKFKKVENDLENGKCELI